MSAPTSTESTAVRVPSDLASSLSKPPSPTLPNRHLQVPVSLVENGALMSFEASLTSAVSASSEQDICHTALSPLAELAVNKSVLLVETLSSINLVNGRV